MISGQISCRAAHVNNIDLWLCIVGRWFNSRLGHFGLSLGKTVYSILPQSTQLQNGFLALIRQCLELVRYMLPTALEYPSGDWNGVCAYRPARGGRLCEHFAGYKTINRIPLPLPLFCRYLWCVSAPGVIFWLQPVSWRAVLWCARSTCPCWLLLTWILLYLR